MNLLKIQKNIFVQKKCMIVLQCRAKLFKATNTEHD